MSSSKTPTESGTVPFALTPPENETSDPTSDTPLDLVSAMTHVFGQPSSPFPGLLIFGLEEDE